MKVLEKNAAIAAGEEKARSREDMLNQERAEYLEALRGDPKFRRFVVEEILDREIESVTDIRNIPIDGTPTATQRILAIAKATRKKLEIVRAKLV